MKSRERHYLLDVLIAAERARSYVAGISYEQFVENELTRDATLRCLTIIGEAAGRISAIAEAEVPDLPWVQMKDLRNVIVHEYEGVNLPLIWSIVTDDLPHVIDVLDPLFAERHDR